MATDKSLDALLLRWRDACFEYLPDRAEELAGNFKTALLGREGPVEIDDLFAEIDAGVAKLELRPNESVPVRRRLSELALAYQPSGGSDMEIDIDPFNGESWNNEESLVAALFSMAGAEVGGESSEVTLPGFVAPVIPAQVGARRSSVGFEAPLRAWEVREVHKGFSLRQGLGVIRRVEAETERVKNEAALCAYVATASLYRLLKPSKADIQRWGREDRQREAEMVTRYNQGGEPLVAGGPA